MRDAAGTLAGGRAHRAPRSWRMRPPQDEFLATLATSSGIRSRPSATRQSCSCRCAQPLAVEQARQLIERQIRHLVTLVDDLLDVSRIKQRKITLRRSPSSYSAWFEQAVDSCPHLTRGRNTRLTVACLEPLYREGTRCGSSRSVNLLTNAIKTRARWPASTSRPNERRRRLLRVAAPASHRARSLRSVRPFMQGGALARPHAGRARHPGSRRPPAVEAPRGEAWRRGSAGLGQAASSSIASPCSRAPPEPHPPLSSPQVSARRSGADRRRQRGCGISLKMVLEVVGATTSPWRTRPPASTSRASTGPTWPAGHRSRNRRLRGRAPAAPRARTPRRSPWWGLGLRARGGQDSGPASGLRSPPRQAVGPDELLPSSGEVSRRTGRRGSRGAGMSTIPARGEAARRRLTRGPGRVVPRALPPCRRALHFATRL